MGQTQSGCRDEAWLEVKASWMKPLETREEMLQRFSEIVSGTTYLEDESWLSMVFRKFASQPGRWSQSDLIFVLSLLFPGSTSLIEDAGPTLYRLVLCAGSFPYVRHPAQELDVMTLQTGVAMLRRYSDEPHGDGSTATNTREERESEYLRLLFLALSQTMDSAVVDERKDVAIAVQTISLHRILRDPDQPKQGYTAAPLPSPETFHLTSHPPNRPLPRANLHAFVRLVLACQLDKCGCGPDHLVRNDDFNKATDAVLAAFDFKDLNSCRWREFHRGMIQLMPGIRIAMDRILDPLDHKPNPVDRDEFDSAPLPKASELVRLAFSNSVLEYPIPGAILDLPLLARLTLFFQQDFLLGSFLDSMLLKYPRNGKQQSAKRLRANITKSSQACLILVSGTSSETAKHVVCGLYLPSGNLTPPREGGAPTIFQCEPRLRVFRGFINTTKSGFVQNSSKEEALKFRIESSTGFAEASIDPNRNESVFTLPANRSVDICTMIDVTIEKFEDLDGPEDRDHPSKDESDGD